MNALIVLLKIFAAIAGAVAWDWLGVTRMGANTTSFDYRYWPLSRPRLISIVLLAGTVAVIAVFVRPDPVNPPVWPIVVGAVALGVWAVVAIHDWFAQRRVGYREPPRYSELEFDADA